MTLDPTVLLTIIGMAVVTYATRVSGFVLIGRMRLTPRVAAWLHYVPAAVLISIIAPAVLPVGRFGGAGASGALTAGPAEALAALAAVLVAARTRNLLVTMAAAVLAVWALRHLFGG